MFGALTAPTLSHAQFDPSKKTATTDKQDRAYRANPRYDKMAREALVNRPKNFDFMRFRSLYSQTRQYDPIAEEALKLLNDLAYTAKNAKDPQKAELALKGYQQVVATHLANLDVVVQALALAREDKRFGSVGFFEWMRDGLINSVVVSRKGRSFNDAFAIITFAEETVILYHLGLQLLKTTPVQEARIYYNMNDVRDLRTGEEWTMFVNTRIPMRFLELQEKESEKNTFDIKKQ